MIDITQPLMRLMKDGVEISRHTSAVEAMERAAESGPGTYTLVRPDATIVVEGAPVVVEPEPPVEPPQEPDPEPETEPLPPLEGPVDARFAEIIQNPATHAYLALNSQKDIDENTRPTVNKGEINPFFKYDPVEEAVKLTVQNGYAIGSKWQIRKYFPNLDHNNCQKVSFQWEFKYGDAYRNPLGLTNLKAFQLSDPDENLMFELQTRMGGDESMASIPTIRVYRGMGGGEATDNDPLSASGPHLSNINGDPIDNWQPGGDTAVDYRQRPNTAADHLNPEKWSPFLILPNVWNRITWEFDFSDGEVRFKGWMSHEGQRPVQVWGSVKEPEKGFLLVGKEFDSGFQFQNWWLEMNTSQTAQNSGVGAESWFRNFVVYKDASIPLD
jgi:hypothetical protein